MGSYPVILASEVQKYLDTEDIKYSFYEDRGLFKATFGLGKSGINSCDVFIKVTDDLVNITTTIPINCSEEYRMKAAEYLTRANYGLTLGNFELDFEDGEVRYKANLLCGASIPSPEVFERCLGVGPSMMKRYGDGLLKVLFADMDPAEAVRVAEDS